jgi:hypothetical protein
MATVCTVVYVPAATEKVGEPAGGAGVPTPETSATPLFFNESVAVKVAALVPTEIGVKLSVVANDPPVNVVVQVPVVAAENAAPEVPVAAKVTVGAGLQPPSFRNVVTLVAVDGLPTGAVGTLRLSTAIL